jgi:hypothetical protein
VMTHVMEARRTIDAKPVAPGAQEERLVQFAESLIAIVVQRTNSFFDNQWKAYRKQVEETKLNLFKDYTPIQ